MFFKTKLCNPAPSHVAFDAFLADIAEIDVIPGIRGLENYAIIAARSNPRWWLLPLKDRRAAAAGLEMLQPVTKAAMLAKVMARGLARFGPHGMLGRSHLRLSALPDLSGAFAGEMAHVAYFTGTDGPHRKTAIQAMDADGTILGYAKLSRAPHIRPYIRNEAQMLERVAGLGLKTADVPRILALRDDGSVTLLVTDSRKSDAITTPLQPGPEHLRWLEELRRKTEQTGHTKIVDDLSDRLAVLESLAGSEWSARIKRVLGQIRPVAETIPLCLAHGDFTPWNSFLQAGRLYVFDWEYATPAWPVGFDLAHFMLATIPPDQQPQSLPKLLEALASAHFGGDRKASRQALILSLVCHALFYLGRLAETEKPLQDWGDGPARGTMIDRLLDGGETGS